MNLGRVSSGRDVPNEINVIIEIPAHADPVDVLVVTPVPLISGSVIRCRPVGVLQMTDEAGDDAKVLASPIDKVSKSYHHLNDYTDFPQDRLETIAHFFEHDERPG